MDTFEQLLESEHKPVERFVRFHISTKADADDVLQEVYITAYQKFQQLKTGIPSKHGSSALQEINVMTISERKPVNLRSQSRT